MTSHRIGDFADDPNWVSFGKSLRHAVQDPSSYGFTSSEKLLAEVARLRGVDTASLRNPLAAVAWIEANAPEALNDKNAHVPMTGVLLLSQIGILDKGLAEKIGPDLFSGALSRDDLRRALDELKARPGIGKIAAHDRVKRAEAFENRVFDYLQSHPDVLGLGERVTVVPSTRAATAPYDFAAIRDGEMVAAIEVKSSRQKLHYRYLVETLAMIALAARKYNRALLVVPEDWGDAIDKIGELIRSLRLDGVQHAMFSEEDGGHLTVFNSSTDKTKLGRQLTEAHLRDPSSTRFGILPGKSEDRILTDEKRAQSQNDASGETKLAAANSAEETNRIVELDPSHIHSAGVEDRMDGGLRDIDALAASIRAVGQKIPILVRPHPQRRGEYEIVAGRRRLEACRIAGLPVRAEIQALDERELVIGQAIENIAREDLTYIERARVAVRMVDEVGLPQSAIDEAFSCGKTDRSRYLKIGRGLSGDILSWIGKAPSVGRPRWERLVKLVARDSEAEPRMRATIEALKDEAANLTSDQRFARIWHAAGQLPEPADDRQLPDDLVSVEGLSEPVARVRKSKDGLEITLFDGTKDGLLEWVEVNKSSVIEQLVRLHERKTGS